MLLCAAGHGAAADDVLGLGEGLKLLGNRRILGMFDGYLGDVVGDILGMWLMSGMVLMVNSLLKKGLYRGCRMGIEIKDEDLHGETEDSPKS